MFYRVYKNLFSPLLHFFMLPLTGSIHACRFHPTCSAYFASAIAKYGIIRGGLLGIRRLLRCHPWSPGGIDYA